MLGEAGAISIAPLVPSESDPALAFRALRRLVQSVSVAPLAVERPPLATSVLLSQFDMFLAAGDRAGAESVLTTLQDDWRLDALNLRYAEARLLSRFDDWSQLTQKPWFEELCRASKPAVVTRILLKAVWHTYLEPFEGHKVEQQARYADRLRTLCVDMLDDVQDALDRGASSIAALEASLAVSEGAVEQTLTAPAPSRCQNWTDWAGSLLGLSPHAIAELTREGALRQPASLMASTEAVRLAEQLQALSDEERRDVLRPALPVVVDWLRDDPDFPRRDMLELYDTTVTLFAYLDDRGQAARDAFLAILDGTLFLGLKDTQYRRLLQDAGEFVDPEAGLSTVYWLFELAETLLRHPGPDFGRTTSALEFGLILNEDGTANFYCIAARCLRSYCRFGRMAAFADVGG